MIGWRRVLVRGPSMSPTLSDGDVVLARFGRAPRPGDVQAAMAAQDRDAVRDLLKHQEASRPKPQKDKKKKPQPKKKKDKWWRTSTEVDPISLEPLSELDYPPFELGPHLFDGRVLAFYLVSTGTFLNPALRARAPLI